MPKELVFSNERPYAEASSALSVVGVYWGNDGGSDGHLQVSTMLINDDLKYETGDGVVHEAEGEEKARRDLWAQGFYVNLDRRGVNALIRNLRRARDQAFGRDE